MSTLKSSNNYLHGIEIIEIDDGVRSIKTPSTSIIGIVSTCSQPLEDIPYNTPILVKSEKDIAKFGLGVLPTILLGIYKQGSPVCVVVRVEDIAQEMDNQILQIAGSITDYTGVYALLKAESTLGVKPKILISPYYNSISENNTPNGIVSALIEVSEKLRAVCVLDGPNTTTIEAIAYAKKISSNRAYMVDPKYIANWDSSKYGDTILSSSSIVAGVIAKTDAEKGFWHSPSNKVLKGISTLNRPIYFNISDSTSEANELNEANVGCIIYSNKEYRLWGNKTLGLDEKWQFLSVRRVADTIYEAIEKNLLWAIDLPFNKNLINDIQSNVQNYINTLIQKGALLGGTVWIDMEENTPENLQSGHLTVDFDIEPPAPMERLTFRAYRNSGYYQE